jgi:hypothetical protein
VQDLILQGGPVFLGLDLGYFVDVLLNGLLELFVLVLELR